MAEKNTKVQESKKPGKVVKTSKPPTASAKPVAKKDGDNYSAAIEKRNKEKAKAKAEQRAKTRKAQEKRSKEKKAADKKEQVVEKRESAKRGINATGGLLLAIGIIGLAICGYMLFLHEFIPAAVAFICASIPLGYLIAVAVSNKRVREGKGSLFTELLVIFGGFQIGAAFGTFVYWSNHALPVSIVCMAGIVLVGLVAAFIMNSERE